MNAMSIAQEVTNAIGAHGAWKMKLRVAINTGSSDADPAIVCRDDCCPLGQWLHGPSLDATIRGGMPYQVVRRLHAEFHQSAGKVLELAMNNRKAEADTHYETDFLPRSEKLVRALTKWKGELA